MKSTSPQMPFDQSDGNSPRPQEAPRRSGPQDAATTVKSGGVAALNRLSKTDANQAIAEGLGDCSPLFAEGEQTLRIVIGAVMKVSETRAIGRAVAERIALRGQDRARSKNIGATPTSPFPLDVLPQPVRRYVEAVARARCVEVSAVATIALVSLASAIGLSRSIYDEVAGWEEFAILWAAIVGDSGSGKSPVVRDLFEVIYERQAELSREHQRKLEELGTKSDASASHPALTHLYTTDATPEAMSQLLMTSPRGIVAVKDELAGFFGFGRYRQQGADAERAFWLSLHSAQPAKIDRASKASVLVEQAAASVVGGIQPDVLEKCFDEAAFASGLAARFLIVELLPHLKMYRPGPTAEERCGYDQLVSQLLVLEMGVDGGSERMRPRRIPLSEEAREVLREFVPAWSEERLREPSSISAAMSKLEGAALRFALVLRVCREVLGGAHADDPVRRDDLESGIRIARWFREQAARVYRRLGAATEEEKRKRLYEAQCAVVRDKFGGRVTARRWRDHRGGTTEKAEVELFLLVERGMLVKRPRPTTSKGGRPTVEYVLPEIAAPEAGMTHGVSGCGVSENGFREAPAESEANLRARVRQLPLCAAMNPETPKPTPGGDAVARSTEVEGDQ